METGMRGRRREGDGAEGKDQAFLGLPNLPPEIIREILLRLPAKSVGRFRCVSKLFLSLLSDPGFSRTHLDLSLRNDALQSGRRRLLISSHNLYAVDYDSIYENGERNWDLVALELNYPLKYKSNVFSELMKGYAKGKFLNCSGSADEDEYPVVVNFDLRSMLYQRNWVDIVGSCNGLVCISPAEGAVFMFNPTTGESKRVPDVPRTLRSGSEEEEFESYGFGFDAFSDDYKLVKLVSADAHNAWVYSLRSDSWKSIGDLGYDYGDSFYTSGVLLNGAVHWVVSLQPDHERVVTAFDLAREEFRDMPLPNETEECSHRFRDFVVGILNGCLCLVNSCHEMHDDIWVMQEYGVAQSWTRIRMSVWYRFMKPLCSGRNGDVLLELDGDLVLYNFENHMSRNMAVRGAQLSDGFEADAYVESLISPNSYGEHICSR